MRALRGDPEMAGELARQGLEVIWKRHTCAHRVDELMNIYAQVRPAAMTEAVQ